MKTAKQSMLSKHLITSMIYSLSDALGSSFNGLNDIHNLELLEFKTLYIVYYRSSPDNISRPGDLWDLIIGQYLYKYNEVEKARSKQTLNLLKNEYNKYKKLNDRDFNELINMPLI